jgi:hypothetical protein
MVRKIRINEDLDDRINSKQVDIDMSKQMGKFFKAVSILRSHLSELEKDVDLTSMILEMAYQDNLTNRTTINAFNKELEEATKNLNETFSALFQLTLFAKKHLPKDVFEDMDDWFRERHNK